MHACMHEIHFSLGNHIENINWTEKKLTHPKKRREEFLFDRGPSQTKMKSCLEYINSVFALLWIFKRPCTHVSLFFCYTIHSLKTHIHSFSSSHSHTKRNTFYFLRLSSVRAGAPIEIASKMKTFFSLSPNQLFLFIVCHKIKRQNHRTANVK